jgi:hypothetical protein
MAAFRDIWQWEWHALIVWGVVAAVTMPLLAVYIRAVRSTLLTLSGQLPLLRGHKYTRNDVITPEGYVRIL